MRNKLYLGLIRTGLLKQLFKIFYLFDGFYAIAQLRLRQTGESMRMVLEPEKWPPY